MRVRRDRARIGIVGRGFVADLCIHSLDALRTFSGLTRQRAGDQEPDSPNGERCGFHLYVPRAREANPLVRRVLRGPQMIPIGHGLCARRVVESGGPFITEMSS